MIVDVHTHAMRAAEHLSDQFVREADRARGYPLDLTVTFEAYLRAMEPVDRCILFGMKARHTGFYVPNEWIAAFAAQAPDKIIPFMSLDPTEPDCLEDFERAHQDLGMRGIKLAPMYANFDPSDLRLDELYRRATQAGLPILFHAGTTFCQLAPLKFTRPALWDEVAIRHPGLRMILAHLGHPYEGEALVTARKHPNVYLDLSALYYRPWQLYNSLILAQEYHVTGKILFGSDYPFATPGDSIAGLYALNRMVEGTHLPRVAESALDEIIHRDSLKLLGIEKDQY
ncbi:MAG TPA: amidohydrolase family protein [Chthonomonadaceae bacterium]|nr:amidohydrolase family protein [Chthonomonadaceae bacterium]